MGTTVSEKLGKALRSARPSGISRESPQTLQDLLEALRTHAPEEGKLQRMLVTTAGHLCQALGEPPHKISINMLLDAEGKLRARLRRIGLRRTSLHAYSNYTKVLLKKAREFGWNENSADVANAWKDIQRATMTVKGSGGIIRYAIQKGKEPKNFGESDLLGWSVSAVERGLRFEYVRKVKAQFRKSVFAAGLGWQMPNLSAPVFGRCYGIPVTDFPEPLHSQVFELVKWKTAKFQLGRPIKAKHRAVTCDSLLGLLSRLFGFFVGIAGKPVRTLEDLFQADGIREFSGWAINKRGLNGRTVAVWLGTLRALGAYPPLAKIDFSWVPDLIAELPKDFEVLAKERKDRRWVPYNVLAQVPDQIRQDTERVYERGERARALMARDALLIEWMTTLPWRQRNIRECKLLPFSEGGNLSKEGIPTNSTMAKAEWAQEQLRENPAETFWQFYFRPEETKTGNIVRAILPYQLVGPLEDYLRCYRPILVDGVDPHTLFLNDHGRSFCSRRLESLVGDLTLRYAGRRVNPHLFRDIFALKWLEDHPEDFLTLSKILWHRNIKTTLQIYGANFDESHGARRVEQWLDARRKATDKP